MYYVMTNSHTIFQLIYQKTAVKSLENWCVGQMDRQTNGEQIKSPRQA